MSNKIVVLFFGVQFGILIILLGILTPYSGAAAVIKFHSDNDKDEMNKQIGHNRSNKILFLGEMEKIILMAGPETTK